MRFFVVTVAFIMGCAHTNYYADRKGETELPGMPFLWKDKDGNLNEGFVKTHSGFGTANFEVNLAENGSYTKFSNNLDSTAAAQLTSWLLDKVFEIGKKVGIAEHKVKMTEVLLKMPDTPERAKALEEIRRAE